MNRRHRHIAWALSVAAAAVIGAALPAGSAERLARIDRADKAERAGAAASAEASWADVSAFMEKHSALKWAAFQKLTDDGRRPRPKLREQLVNRFTELNRLASKEPALYKVEVDRVEIEDKIFGSLLTLKRAHSDSERQSAQSALHDEVRSLLVNRMEYRKVRRDGLAASLKTFDEEVRRDDALQSNSADFDRRINERVQKIERAGLGGAAANPRPNLPRSIGAAARNGVPRERSDPLNEPAQ